MSVDAVAASAPEAAHANAAQQAGAQEAPTGPQADAAAAQLLRSFLAAHEARAQLYTRLHDGFRATLQSGQEGPYRQLLAELTDSFNDVSKQVIAIEHQLVDTLHRPQLAAHLRHAQEQERHKLRHTLTLQALRHAESRKGFSWQQEQGDYSSARERGKAVQTAAPSDAQPAADQGHDQGTEAAAAAVADTMQGSCGHAHTCCGNVHGEAAPEPTEEEFRGAVAEASQLLDATVAAINEEVEEVRYAIEELMESAAAD